MIIDNLTIASTVISTALVLATIVIGNLKHSHVEK
jgi:hypothetical protein